MTDIALRLKDELLRLSDDDREALAHVLIDSLENNGYDDGDAACAGEDVPDLVGHGLLNAWPSVWCPPQ